MQVAHFIPERIQHVHLKIAAAGEFGGDAGARLCLHEAAQHGFREWVSLGERYSVSLRAPLGKREQCLLAKLAFGPEALDEPPRYQRVGILHQPLLVGDQEPGVAGCGRPDFWVRTKAQLVE